jgi:hypothetical protein
MRDLTKQNEILRRFDEVLSDKVGGARLRDVVAEAGRKYAS